MTFCISRGRGEGGLRGPFPVPLRNLPGQVGAICRPCTGQPANQLTTQEIRPGSLGEGGRQRQALAEDHRLIHYSQPAEVCFAFRDDSLPAYRRAAEYLNVCKIDVASIQHEYGIFGGPAGEHVLTLIRGLRMPVHTTLHTVLAEPAVPEREVMEELVGRSARLAVMTERGRLLLRDRYGVEDNRIDVIPHGVPGMPLLDPAASSPQLRGSSTSSRPSRKFLRPSPTRSMPCSL